MQELAFAVGKGPQRAKATGKKLQEEVMSTKYKWLITVISVSLAALALAAAGPGYHVAATYKVGGDGGWDYLTADASARRLYISRGTSGPVEPTTRKTAREIRVGVPLVN